MSQTQQASADSRPETQQREKVPARRLPRPLRVVAHHQITAAMLLLFALSLMVQSITGYRNQSPNQQNGLQSYLSYLVSNSFLETVGENWEGEFLPLTAYVIFTSFLHERGAKESRNPDKTHPEKTDKVPRPQEARQRKDAPWPLKVGGPVRWVYLHSIALAFLLLFLAAVTVHATAGLGSYNSTLVQQHEHPVTILGYMTSNTFWLQSTRNWEAGFFSTAMLAFFSIFLREKGSPVSKVSDQPDKGTADEGAENG